MTRPQRAWAVRKLRSQDKSGEEIFSILTERKLLKAPFTNDAGLKRFAMQHGFKPAEAEKLHISIRGAAPAGVWASADKQSGAIRFPLPLLIQRGEVEPKTVLHELGHIKDDWDVRQAWNKANIEPRLQKLKKDRFARYYLPKWTDTASWEIFDTNFDPTPELMAESFAEFHLGGLDDKAISDELVRGRKYIHERRQQIRELPTTISVSTGLPYGKGSDREKALKRDIRMQQKALRSIGQVDTLSKDVKKFWADLLK